MKTYKGKIKKLKSNQICVVGTNSQSIHGAGAALWAKLNAGLKLGHSRGLCGQSYGIVTKDLTRAFHPSISINEIVSQLKELSIFAEHHPEKEFLIFYSGIGYNLNGYTPQEMADMFSTITWPENVIFEHNFSKLMKPQTL